MVVQSRKGATRRLVGGLVVAVVLAAPNVAAQVIIRNPCEGLTPSDWAYWMYSCWAYGFIQALLHPAIPMVIR